MWEISYMIFNSHTGKEQEERTVCNAFRISDGVIMAFEDAEESQLYMVLPLHRLIVVVRKY